MHTTPPLPMPAPETLARRRSDARLGWAIHATVFVLVNLLLLLKSATSGHHWVIFPAFGWGLGLLIHGFVVFFRSRGCGLHQSWLERERLHLPREHH